MKRFTMAAAGGAAAIVLGLLWARPRATVAPPRLTLLPAQLVADGNDSAVLTVEDATSAEPRIFIDPAHAASVEDLSASGGRWTARIRAGVTPAAITVRVQAAARAEARASLATELDPGDSAADGTPDFLRLDDSADRRSFRRWFTFLAEVQFFQPAAGRPAEIVDCAALIRYAYREALRSHDGNWATEAHLPLAPAFPSPAKYRYPFTPLGAALFRVTPGAFQPSDLTTGAFAQFADAGTLQLRNTHRVTRDIARAEPGDLLFYRQDTDRMPFHSMIYLGESQVEKGAARYLVYHTGPDPSGPGEIRRPTVDELLHFPVPDWRPLPGNPRFLGVYRWNILRGAS